MGFQLASLAAHKEYGVLTPDFQDFGFASLGLHTISRPFIHQSAAFLE
jgi:hypothetical protein